MDIENADNSDNNDDNGDHNLMMVDPPPFDIYLCDYCEAELYSLQAYLVSPHARY